MTDERQVKRVNVFESHLKRKTVVSGSLTVWNRFLDGQRFYARTSSFNPHLEKMT